MSDYSTWKLIALLLGIAIVLVGMWRPRIAFALLGVLLAINLFALHGE